MRDNNSRVKLLALQTMEQMLPTLSECLSNLIPLLVETAAGNLTSSTQIARAASALLDSFMEHFGKNCYLLKAGQTEETKLK